MHFKYILQKIQDAQLQEFPFVHLEISNIFSDNDFESIVNSSDIKINDLPNDVVLFESLFSNGFRIIDFPGCVSDYNEYIEWHKNKRTSNKTNTACEGFGVVLRLIEARTKIVQDLMAFLESKEFIDCIANKFDLSADKCTYDCGIQKYLDGYEISPHPDIRKKALTYMVNINPSPMSETSTHHTHYMKFKPEFSYISEYWRGNKEADTCWVPWSWCETVKQQVINNSLVIFSPNEETIHAVKAEYDHLKYQRTQLYGNLWYEKSPCSVQNTKWEDLSISHTSNGNDKSTLEQLLPWKVRNFVKNMKTHKQTNKTHHDRGY